MSYGKSSRTQTLTVWVMGILILVPSVYGFGSKFIEFIKLAQTGQEGAFALAPIVNYLLASTGFFLLFFWAIGLGMFREIERPKFELLEREQRLDAQEDRDAVVDWIN